MKKIIITQYLQYKEDVLGAWKYWHTIQYGEGTYPYDLNMTQEGLKYLINHLKPHNEVILIVKP